MFKKTTSLAFQNYGSILNAMPKSTFSKFQNKLLKVQNKTVNRLYSYNCDVIIKMDKGLGLLLICDNPNLENIERFVIHRITRIKKNMYFNFIALSSEARIILNRPNNNKKVITNLDKEITYEKIVSAFRVKEIFAYYYQVRNTNYKFSGESHPYWEITYIDNGTLQTTILDKSFTLNAGDLIIYTPKQFHTQSTPEESSCSYLTIMFDMSFNDIPLLDMKKFSCNKDQVRILQNFITTLNDETNLYNHDLLLCYLKELIIKLVQFDNHAILEPKALQIQHRFESELLNEIIVYINDNIYKPLVIEELCTTFNLSRSSLQTLFKDNLQVAPKQYINELKLTRSKLLIKENKHTISEISNMLGFGSIHYFSRKFKQHYNLSPTEYAKSLFN